MSANIDPVRHIAPIETPRAISRDLPRKRDQRSPYRQDTVEIHDAEPEQELVILDTPILEDGHIDFTV